MSASLLRRGLAAVRDGHRLRRGRAHDLDIAEVDGGGLHTDLDVDAIAGERRGDGRARRRYLYA
ncbi:MAG: hypothetical protein ACYDHY_06905 [Acidiferrobacterales bacterium]